MNDWSDDFFDEDYLRIWAALTPQSQTEHEVDVLWSLLGLRPAMRVLDAPCGYGRVSTVLARRGAAVLGVDRSGPLLAEAARRSGPDHDRLRFLRHDLRDPLPESGFDVALNLLNSLGYGSERDDLAVLRTLAAAVVPGGKVVVDTMHRDAVAVYNTRGSAPDRRTPDGTVVRQRNRFDPLTGRDETTWSWSGPGRAGRRTMSVRMYCLTELVVLLDRAGLSVLAAHPGYSADPYEAHAADPAPVLLVAERRPPR